MELVLLEAVLDHLPKGFDPYWIYGIEVDGIQVGTIVYRQGTLQQRYYDGHIGYTIDEEYRGHGYAYQACLKLKELLQFDEVIITCDPYNIASKRTIEKLSTTYIETITIPSSQRRFFTKEEKEKRVYIWR